MSLSYDEDGKKQWVDSAVGNYDRQYFDRVEFKRDDYNKECVLRIHFLDPKTRSFDDDGKIADTVQSKWSEVKQAYSVTDAKDGYNDRVAFSFKSGVMINLYVAIREDKHCISRLPIDAKWYVEEVP